MTLTCLLFGLFMFIAGGTFAVLFFAALVANREPE